MKKQVLFILVFLGMTLSGYSQSKKMLRTYGISQRTTTVQKFENETPLKAYVTKIERYDKRGEWIEKIDYQKDGEIKKHEIRDYHKRLLTNEVLDFPLEKEWVENTPSYDRRVYVYNKKRLLIEDKDLSRKGNVKQRREYTHNKYGDVVSRKTFDKDGELRWTDFYTYDKKGFRTEQKRIGQNGETVEIRTYTYEK